MILLLGGSGYIGTAFREAMERRGIAFVDVTRTRCNYYQPERLDELISETSPEFLINAAGFTGKPNVDACESQKSECILANVVLPGIIRDVCDRRELPWGHVSSGCIYNGTRSDGLGFSESDAPNFTFRQNNCSFYSGCKAMGEELLQGAEACYVWRLRIPFDHMDCPRNYLTKVMRYERLLDVRNSLAHLGEFVDACLDCWQRRLSVGVYNLTNSGSIRTSEIVDMIRRSGLCNKRFEFFASEEEFMRLAAQTPRSSCELDNTKAKTAGLRLSHVVDAVQASLDSWQAESGSRQNPAPLRRTLASTAT